MNSQNLEAPQSGGRTFTLHFFDGSSRNVPVVDVEEPYPDGRLIVSRTDPGGVITHVNQSFVDMSGYSEAELLGTPHHILRHPDMPPAAFKGLWDTIKAGNRWQGYVKNLRKDGRFYWVYATVIPNLRRGKLIGYTSVRRKPSRLRIKECEALYPTLF
ncbi:MAG: PAS domain-containing protein [gamma proteobacterium endosymbiont of Lamellibrachia anaximandri]|nr:PAS domain-containing protein [gamma proteobacterium endosymbiont of Lamellibrachia anaximandri]